MSYTTGKRPRTPSSHSSTTSGTSTDRDQPTPKALRTVALHPAHVATPPTHSQSQFQSSLEKSSAAVTSRPLLCTLPPTCNPPVHRATPLANTKELERHYATYHAHVCEQRGCGCVFPDARLLELHQTECHDPIAAVRKDRGEKIFACHLASCPRLFAAPKTRRLHLIQAHGYPKEYFFAVTNKGVGGLLKKWGEGASLVRGPWKARDRREADGVDDDDDGEERDEDEDEEDSEEEVQAATNGRNHTHAHARAEHAGDSPDASVLVEEEDDDDDEDSDKRQKDDTLDQITNAMGSLTLVPSSIRFGRGAKRGGYTHTPSYPHNGGHGRGHSHGRGGHHARNASADAGMDVDGFGKTDGHGPGEVTRGRGRGMGRGRGRGGARGGGPNANVPENGQHKVEGSVHHVPPRGLGGGRRSGFPRGGRVVGRLVAARGTVGRGI